MILKNKVFWRYFLWSISLFLVGLNYYLFDLNIAMSDFASDETTQGNQRASSFRSVRDFVKESPMTKFKIR